MGRVRAENVVGNEDLGITHPLGGLGKVLDCQWVWLDLCLGENHSNFQFLLLEISIFVSLLANWRWLKSPTDAHSRRERLAQKM